MLRFRGMPEISWQEFILWLLRRRRRVTIVNRSMLPTIKPGDEILFRPDTSKKVELKVGDVVILQHPQDVGESLIKRIVRIYPDHQMDLRGDNVEESTDSRQFGLVPREWIVGKVTCLF